MNFSKIPQLVSVRNTQNLGCISLPGALPSSFGGGQSETGGQTGVGWGGHSCGYVAWYGGVRAQASEEGICAEEAALNEESELMEREKGICKGKK